MKTLIPVLVCLLLAACHEDESSDIEDVGRMAQDVESVDIVPSDTLAEDMGSGLDAVPELPQHPESCDPEADKSVVKIQRGEESWCRQLVLYPSQEVDDDGSVRTVVPLKLLFDEEIVEDPSVWRFQAYGSDEYTLRTSGTWGSDSSAFSSESDCIGPWRG